MTLRTHPPFAKNAKDGAPQTYLLIVRKGGPPASMNPHLYKKNVKVGQPPETPCDSLTVVRNILRRDLEGDAGVVLAAVLGGAENVALIVEDHAPGKGAVRAVEPMQNAIVPAAVFLRR